MVALRRILQRSFDFSGHHDRGQGYGQTVGVGKQRLVGVRLDGASKLVGGVYYLFGSENSVYAARMVDAYATGSLREAWPLSNEKFVRPNVVMRVLLYSSLFDYDTVICRISH
jgi:hypothetical protein